MGKVVLTHTLRCHMRSSTLRWLAALGISLSALGALLPVRFREHDEVLLETFQATHLLLGLLFSALLALPALRPEQRLYAPTRWGLPAARPHAIVLWDAVGTVLALLALVAVTTVAQGAILFIDGSGIGLQALIGLAITSYAYSCSLVGWGRLLGRYLPAVPGMVVLFAIAVAPRWIAEALRGDSAAAPSAPTWRALAMGSLPCTPPGPEEFGVVGILLMTGSALMLFLAVNLFLSWSLGHLSARGSSLDPSGSGS